MLCNEKITPSQRIHNLRPVTWSPGENTITTVHTRLYADNPSSYYAGFAPYILATIQHTTRFEHLGHRAPQDFELNNQGIMLYTIKIHQLSRRASNKLTTESSCFARLIAEGMYLTPEPSCSTKMCTTTIMLHPTEIIYLGHLISAFTAWFVRREFYTQAIVLNTKNKSATQSLCFAQLESDTRLVVLRTTKIQYLILGYTTISLETEPSCSARLESINSTPELPCLLTSGPLSF